MTEAVKIATTSTPTLVAAAPKPKRKYTKRNLSVAAKIRKLSRQGFSAAEIAKRLGVPSSRVHNVRYYDRRFNKAVYPATPKAAKAPKPVKAKVIATRPSLWERIKAVFVFK